MKENDSAIVLREVTKYYVVGSAKNRGVVDVSLDIHQGSFLALVGPSGAGKTTLLNIIAGIIKPDTGTVKVLGKEINSMKQSEIARFRLRNIGYIFQDYNLINELTVIENVILPGLFLKEVDKKELERKGKELLALFGLEGYENRMPDELSGGEQQRVVIARVLINDPSIVLADEPTSNLDVDTGKRVVEILYKICKEQGKTVILATHDQEIISKADVVVHIRDGRISTKSV